jgi:hypothetical protein
MNLKNINYLHEGFLLAVIAFVVYYVNVPFITNDEPFSIFFAFQPIGVLISTYLEGNNAPFYEILLHVWIKLFGAGELSVRTPSLIFFALSGYLIYKTANLLINKNLSWMAAVLFLTSNYAIYFAFEARPYALFSLLTIGSLYFYLLSLTGTTKKSRYLLLLVNTLLIFTHFLGIIIPIVQLVITLFIKNDTLPKGFRKTIYIWILLISPWLFFLVNKFVFNANNGTWVYPVENYGHLLNVFYTMSGNTLSFIAVTALFTIVILKYLIRNFQFLKHRTTQYSIILLGIIVFFVSISLIIPMPFFWKINSASYFFPLYSVIIAGLATLLFFKFLEAANGNIILLLVFVIPLLSMFYVSFYVPLFIERYYNYLFPLFCIAVFIAVSYSFKNTYLQLLTGLGLVLLSLINIDKSISNGVNTKESVREIVELRSDNTLVIISPSYFKFNFAYYFDDNLFTSSEKYLDSALNKQKIVFLNKEDQLYLPLKEYEFKHLIYLDAYTEFSFPGNTILNTLKANFSLQKTKSFDDDFVLYVFSKP